MAALLTGTGIVAVGVLIMQFAGLMESAEAQLVVLVVAMIGMSLVDREHFYGSDS